MLTMSFLRGVRSESMKDARLVQIVEGIAEAKEVDPEELDMRLHDHIDTDAIRRLESRDTGPWTLSFELDELEVTVGSDGRVVVDDALPVVHT